MSTALEYSTRVVQEGGRRCTLNDLVHLTPLRIPLMNPPHIDIRRGRVMSSCVNFLSLRNVYCIVQYSVDIKLLQNPSLETDVQ